MRRSLNGIWRATVADDHLRRSGVGLEVDDSTWSEIVVPSHWQSLEEFRDSPGPILYRHHFSMEPANDDERFWIEFAGIYYQGDAWMDGAYLGDPEGYFLRHHFEITDLSKLADEHVLAVEVSSPRSGDRKSKRNITGIFDENDFLDPSWNMGGIWRDVSVYSTGSVRIATLRVLCRDANDSRAHVRLSCELDSNSSQSVLVRTLVNDQLVRADEHMLGTGNNSLDWTIDIENPSLWWPWQLGQQSLTDISVEVLCSGQISDTASRTTGLREVSVDNWHFTVNGERLFAKGIALAPTALEMAQIPPEQVRADIALAKDLGMNLVRPLAHVARTELYEAADELGIMIWQDMPLHGSYARSVRKQAVKQAKAMVDELNHHPSIVMWCAHNQPTQPDPIHQQIPTWTRSVLDAWVKRAIADADDSRPVTAHSGVLPHFPNLDGTDMNASFGWRHGDYRDLTPLAARLPKLVRFVSGFGAQSAPLTADFASPQSWPNIDWDNLSIRYGMQRDAFERHTPSTGYLNWNSWALATQKYQSELLKFHIESLRRLKYQPTGGFCMLLLADAQPSISYGIYDSNRVPKSAVEIVRQACREVIVVADQPPRKFVAGNEFTSDIHVVSDVRTRIKNATVTAVLTWPSGSKTWAWSGDIEPDSCTKVGAVAMTISSRGTATLTLNVTADDVNETNRYDLVIS